MKIFKYTFLKEYRKREIYKKQLRKLYPDSKILPLKNCPLNLFDFGKYSYGNINILTFGSKNEKLKIGNFVSIAKDVTFILSGGHYTETFTTYPFKTEYFGEKESETLCKGPITVCDDVWIGYGAIILSGVTIGQGAVVGAGSVVTKDVEPYSIVGGNPTKLIKYRFSKELIEEMKKIDFSKLEPEKFREVKELLYQKLDFEVLEEIKKYL